MAKNRVIGQDNKMPWHLPADLKHFKAVTLGKPVIMGRLTYESIGKALPGRDNIVISSRPDYQLHDAFVVSSCVAAIELARKNSDDVMVIGGGTIYRAFLSQATHLYLTFIDLEVTGDTHFPDWLETGQWQQTAYEAFTKDEKNPYNYEFVTLERS
jgi:dihydrofolate reductase